MARRPQMTTAVGSVAAPQAGGGAGPNPQTDDEKTVQFINAEVLDPPTQGSISFVGPYLDQTLAMAVEDARSFVQGAEQILLVALAKALEKALSGGAAPPLAAVSAEAAPAAVFPVATPAPDAGLKAIEGFLASLSNFHGAMAETAHKHRMDR